MTDQAEQIVNAAALVVRPETDPSTRQAASAFLEKWTQSAEAWDLYGPWLTSFVTNNHHHHSTVGVELLCLQLLQAKIRRELPRSTQSNPSLEAIRSALSQLILKCQQGGHDFILTLQSACICLTSLEVRIGNLSGFCSHILASCVDQNADLSTSLAPLTALRLLGEIPTEVEACSDLNAAQVTAELSPYWNKGVEVLSSTLAQPATCCLAAHALRTWVRACHVSLSQLNMASSPGQPVILHLLVQLLSHTQYADDQATLLTAVSRALITVLRQPADSCTPSRHAAVKGLVDATRVDGFIGAPLLKSTSAGWDDTAHSLVSLLCTLLTEDIDDIVQMPADGLLHLMLEVQRTHPQIRIKSLVLESWLTVQEIPTAERHENWRAPLCARITNTLLEALAYPAEFVNWNEEFNLEQSEFEEYRRLAPDVLSGCYSMLRVDFLHLLSQPIQLWTSSPSSCSWTSLEAALYAFAATGRDVCGRIKTNVGGTSIMQDKESTSAVIRNVAEAICSTQPPPNPFLTESICRFIGAYGAAWAMICTPESILKLLDYVRSVLEHSSPQHSDLQMAASLAIKSLLTVSATSMVKDANALGPVVTAMQNLFRISLGSHCVDVMTNVTEGCVRLLMNVSDAASRDQSLVALVQALTHRGHEALSIVPTDGSSLSDQALDAVDTTVMYLKVLGVIVKFAQTDGDATQILSSALSQHAWPYLEAASQRLSYCQILDGVLAVQEQLLRSAPDLFASQFSSTIHNCVAVFERNKNPSALSYINSAVEAYGAREAELFEKLLSHISNVFFTYISNEKPAQDCTELVQVYFEMCERYLLFCPTAIVHCEALLHMVMCGVECMTASRGERNSTRATINFLEKFVSWRRLPVSTDARQALEMGAQRFDEIIASCGQRLLQSCFDILVGGPRPLWPPCGECIFALVVASISWPVPEASDSCVGRQWLEAVSLNLPKDAKLSHSEHAFHQVVVQLLALAQKGPTMKAKAKMLLSDFSQAVNGHKGLETA